jgi:biopolymer transport protein ExbB
MTENRSVLYFLCAALVVGAFAWTIAQESPASNPGGEQPALAVKEPNTGNSPSATPESAEARLETLWDLMMYAKGFMVVLTSLSFIGVFLAIFYAITITEERLIRREFLRKVYDLVNHGNFVDAGALCEKLDGALPRILASGLRRREMGIMAVSEGMAGVGSREMERYRHRIRHLLDVATLAPMIGFLGTVWGMIEAFKVFGSSKTGQLVPGDLAASISKALITTAAGLVIAIPAMAVYFYLRGRLVRIGTQLEERSAEFAERLISARASRGGSGDVLR